MDNKTELKSEVKKFWNRQACGTQFSSSEKFTREYFDEIENYRYATEPEIFSFAQFTRWRGKKVLEVGVGAATDFIQWVRAGAIAQGVDMTEEGVEHARRRLEAYGLEPADVRRADAEQLPFPDGQFDLVYSWGVIHHTPDTEKALREIVRVCRPGGTCKVMIYHRRSLTAFHFWLRWALFSGRPWKSFAWCLHHYMESIGTKAYTRREASAMLNGLPVENVSIKTILTIHDLRGADGRGILRAYSVALAWLLGWNRVGWFMTIEFNKKDS